MPRGTKDQEYPNLYFDEKKDYFFRKYLTEAGGEIYRSLKTKSRSVAIRRMNQVLADLPSFAKKKKCPSIDEVILEMYEIYQQKARATYENFEYFCRAYITPYFTGQEISEVAKQWKPFKAHVRKQKPDMSLWHVRKNLVSILNYAAEREYIDAVPKLKLDPGERISQKPIAYDELEVIKILTEAPPKEAKLQPRTVQKLRLQTRLVLFHGMRPPQEIRHIRIQDIDLERGLISLQSEIVKTRDGRIVKIDQETIFEIKQWIKDLPPNSLYLFPHRNDPTRPSTSSDKSWQRLKKALGFEGKRYWFRHSHATAAVEAGESTMAVTKNMGTSKEMLDRVYVRPSQKTKDRIASAVKSKYGFEKRYEQ